MGGGRLLFLLSLFGVMGYAGVLWLQRTPAPSANSLHLEPRSAAGRSAPRSLQEVAVKSPAIPADPTLLRQRKYRERTLRSAESFLSAKSFRDRANIYCEYETGDPSSPAMAFSGGRSPEDLKEVYEQLMRDKPETMQGEQNRQHDLYVVRELLGTHYGSVQQCVDMVTSGLEQMPSDAEERSDAQQAWAEIEEIDGQLPGSSH